MASYDNPAGRLHELLRQYSADQNVTIVDGWSRALGVPTEDVPLHIGQVARLLPEVVAAALEADPETFEHIPDQVRSLAGCVFPITTAFNSTVAQAAPDANAMVNLRTLSLHLHTVATEGEVPVEGDADLENLKAEIRLVIDEIEASESLPSDVQRLMLRRLNDMLAALQAVRVGGPDDVRRAAEALAATVIFNSSKVEDEHDRNIFQHAMQVAKGAVIIVAIASQLVGMAADLKQLYGDEHALPPALEQRMPRLQLPPGPATPELPGGDEVA